MIRRRAARLLLVSMAVPVLFGCKADTTTAPVSGHGPGATSGVAVLVAPSADDTVAALRAASTTAVPSTSVPPTTTAETIAPPTTEAPAPAGPVNEMQPAPTTTTTAPPVTAPAPRPTAPAAAATFTPAADTGVRLDAAAAADFAARTNGLRASLGLAPLGRNAQLDAYAASWARELATSGQLRHSSSPDRAVANGWVTAGENVGSGASVTSVHNALVASAGHYANLAGPAYTSIGVAVAIAPDGRLWLCEVFGG